MRPKFRLTIRLPEIMLMIFELTLGLAGLVMVSAALWGPADRLYLPAKVLAGMVPLILTVGFAAWLVYRYRCLSRARHKLWARCGAFCLGFVAMGFGAAVGKLNIVLFSDAYESAVALAINDPVLKRDGLTSLLAFLGIGFVFSVTFLLKAARGPWDQHDTIQELHVRIDELGRRMVGGWNEQLVARIDRLLVDGKTNDAVTAYRATMGCSQEEAVCVIGDWPENRLRLEVECLTSTLQQEAVEATKETVGVKG